MQFLPNLLQTSWIGKLKRVNKEQVGCPVGFSEELIAVFKLKKTQIGIEFDIKPKVFQFSKILCNCCQNFDRFRGLEC